MWKDFKTSPPYDAYEDVQRGLETDYTYAWFIWEYVNPMGRLKGPHLSFKACKFEKGCFEFYGNSPYLADQIKILAWLDGQEADAILLRSYLSSPLAQE